MYLLNVKLQVLANNADQQLGFSLLLLLLVKLGMWQKNYCATFYPNKYSESIENFMHYFIYTVGYLNKVNFSV